MEKIIKKEGSPFNNVTYDPAKYGKNGGSGGPSPPFAM